MGTTKVRHQWTVKDKTGIHKLMKQGKTVSEIKKTLFPFDKTVNNTCLYKVIQRLGIDPTWENYVPKTVNYSTPVQSKSGGRRKSKLKSAGLHYWNVEEKRELQQLLKQGLGTKEILNLRYKTDFTVGYNSLDFILRKIKSNPEWVNQSHKYAVKVNPTVNQSQQKIDFDTPSTSPKKKTENEPIDDYLIGDFTIVKEKIQQSRNDIETFIQNICDLIDDSDSPLSKKQILRLTNLIKSEKETIFKENRESVAQKVSHFLMNSL